jgi:hypothetical protein
MVEFLERGKHSLLWWSCGRWQLVELSIGVWQTAGLPTNPLLPSNHQAAGYGVLGSNHL